MIISKELKEERGGGEKSIVIFMIIMGGGGKRGEKTRLQEGNMVKYTN